MFLKIPLKPLEGVIENSPLVLLLFAFFKIICYSHIFNQQFYFICVCLPVICLS